MARIPVHPAAAAGAVVAPAPAAILGALAFEHIGGYIPCALCLEQRWPYYIGIPVALATGILAWLRAPRPILIAGFLAIAGLFAYGAGLGAYHAGVEWGLWTGPDCTAGAGLPASAGDLFSSLSRSRLVPCDQAAWRFLGLSLAGYNALIAAAIMVLALAGAIATRDYGSSSLSQ
jgi:disulfide bond formation protein DsbB